MQMQFKKCFPNKWYDVLYLAIYLFLLLSAIETVIRHIIEMNGISVTDSLYNFAGGFIRRGLGGEILFFIQDWLHIPMSWTLYSVSVAAYFFLTWCVVRAFLKKGYGWNVLIMSFALGGVYVYGFDECRRDFIELLLFAIVLFSFRKLPLGRWLPAANVIVMFGIALHEATFFFTVPILVMISNLRLNNLLKSTCCWIPSLLMFVTCCACKGSSEIYAPIVERAIEHAPQCFPGGSIPDMLTYVAADAKLVFKIHMGLNFLGIQYLGPVPVPAYLITFFYFVYIPYVAVAMLISFTPGRISAVSRNNLVRIIVFQFICLIPMLTILSCDIGRVTAYWIMSSLLVWLLAGDKECGRLLNRCGAVIDHCSDKVFSGRVPGRAALTVMMLTIGVVLYVRAPLGVFEFSLGGRIVSVLENLLSQL